MNAFERGNLACAERDLRVCLEELAVADETVSAPLSARGRIIEARLRAKWALEAIEKAVQLSEVET